ncbi:hypothetical protein JX265_011014 [Neoarthrinium moseri]|uniref:Uncharacterized protein n=1 Tax=Neoarthrinium moseri TaxID=1658444 RepID=A0A9Q0AHZ6_9PEZI|nr:uncharacterized protein JN550_009622 [Neoarthrinium moseri]KAI1851779.1 hypothetical protein JX266_003241 [Neoarthrinium moseri]KAI1857984.1 hypothetical protein JX265_011014 [Neoarthrinium moseri]KAI1863302.1 hypothetical protein JN550_009622 [Neoarthrinium moseri]
MSSGGGGGFYKYRCKYFYTHNCPNWVYVNNSACSSCCAEGRDMEIPPGPSRNSSRDIFVPRAADGELYYTLMEMVNMDEASSDWTLRYKANQDPVSTVVTSATPGPPVLSRSM